MQTSDQVQLGRKASLIDGASDSEDEEEPALKQSEREDEAHEAEEVCMSSWKSSQLLSLMFGDKAIRKLFKGCCSDLHVVAETCGCNASSAPSL